MLFLCDIWMKINDLSDQTDDELIFGNRQFKNM